MVGVGLGVGVGVGVVAVGAGVGVVLPAAAAAMVMRSACTESPERAPVTAMGVPTGKSSRAAGFVTVPNRVCPLSTTVTVLRFVVTIVQWSPSMTVIAPCALGDVCVGTPAVAAGTGAAVGEAAEACALAWVSTATSRPPANTTSAATTTQADLANKRRLPGSRLLSLTWRTVATTSRGAEMAGARCSHRRNAIGTTLSGDFVEMVR